MNIAVIPARGGSKRIPRKNLKEFCGKPMIAWAIEAAKASGCFDDIIVSTDDDEISTIAQAYGASAPFKRPGNLSDDYTGTTPVIKHAVEWYEMHVKPVSYVCCIYATAPFLQPEDIRQGLASVKDTGVDYAFSATSYAFPIQRALRLSEGGRVSMFQPQHFNTRSQDLEEAWHDAGQFYWGEVGAWTNEKTLFSERSVAVMLPRHRVQDIDTLEDWTRAEWLFKAMQEV
ncbi:pseudaminic acid cytidylyltransferase [Idiomarina sp. HB]|uniref:pseudaminic acid cytidylyltransferase n=1 Tax=Idiomarina sp. HB TaxID=3110479 RepID=UPI003A804F87